MAFYEALNEYNYDKKQLDTAHYRDINGQLNVAHSPTKRLICMKNSQFEHIKQIRDRNLINNKTTSMVYMASPERSYVVKSNHKIDYKLAFKRNPSRFYDEALKAPIIKHKIQQQRQSLSPKEKSHNNLEKKYTLGSSLTSNGLGVGNSSKGKRRKDHEVYTIVTKKTTRPHNRINQKIKSKIEQKLGDKNFDQVNAQGIQKYINQLDDAHDAQSQKPTIAWPSQIKQNVDNNPSQKSEDQFQPINEQNTQIPNYGGSNQEYESGNCQDIAWER